MLPLALPIKEFPLHTSRVDPKIYLGLLVFFLLFVPQKKGGKKRKLLL